MFSYGFPQCVLKDANSFRESGILNLEKREKRKEKREKRKEKRIE